MRIRSIKPDFFKDDELAALPPLARLLFVGLWCMADCEGRLEDRPSRIRAEVLPYDECDIDDLLSVLHAAEFIVRYDVPPRGYIEVRSFKKHQRLSGIEASKESELPSPDHPEASEKHPRNIGETSEKHRRSGRCPGREGKGREGKGTVRGASQEALAAARLRSPADESEWLAYVGATYPDWPRADALSAHGWYESKAWAGVRDWRACAKTCYYRWAGKPAPRNGTALVGSHPAQPSPRDLSTAPAEIRDIARRIARREETTEAEDERYAAWREGMG